MRIKPGAVSFYCDPIIGNTEMYSSKCQHCQSLTDIPSQRKMMEYVDLCRSCMGLICLNCSGKPCIPAMRRIEEAERAYYRQQQFRKNLGV